MNTEQKRADFEAWYLENNDVPREAIERKGDGYVWIGTDEAWEIWQAAQAALQSQGMERIIGAARAALNESFEVNDEHSSIGIPSDRAAYLSLLLDEYDHARRIEGES